MPSVEASNRYFVGIGVGEYNDASLCLPKVAGDVAKIAAWFERHPRMAHTRVLHALSESPTCHQIQTSLRAWLEDRRPDDVVVIYIASHGEQEGGKAYLLGRDSPRAKLAGAAIEAETLGAILGEHQPHNILLIVDACVAGRLGSRIQRGAEDASDVHNTRDPHRSWAQVVLCSAFGRDPAHDGKFADAFINVISNERWTGTILPWVDIDQVMRGLNEELRSISPTQVAERKVWGPSPAELIPNPNFATRRLGTLIAKEELAAHFDPASRGVRRGESGSFFTGRSRELRRIVQWLKAASAESSAGDLLVVTGSPGSGKSALLARAVVLSDPVLKKETERLDALPADTVPEQGSFDCVVWCHNKSMRQVVREVGASVERAVETPAELLEACRGRRLTVAIDALDEALHGEAANIAVQVIAPLARLPGVRVLVATRSNPVRESGGRADLIERLGAGTDRVIVLDQSVDHRQDLFDYVKSQLLAGKGEAASHYRRNDRLTAQLASKVRDAADRSFLVGAIAARTLASAGTPADPDSADLALPKEAGEAMASYIERLDSPQRARDVLRPLAWAQGSGLPWGPLWSRLASALATLVHINETPKYSDADVQEVLNSAGDLIVETVEHGEPVYRLFHEALSEYLRRDYPAAMAHSAIADAIVAHIAGRAWTSVHPYIVAHLPRHLALAKDRTDELTALVTDPLWERAKRDHMDDPMAWAADVDLALDAIAASRSGNLRAISCCVVYSRTMATAPVVILEVLARAGQVRRAELMANNISAATDRVLAYCNLAPVYAEEADQMSASRCLDEAVRSLMPVVATHRPMAWFYVCRAAAEAKFPERARLAAESALSEALKLKRELETRGDTWDLANALFWAGMAARLLADDEALRKVRRTLPHDIASFRNQSLQAACVAGDKKFLGQILERFMSDVAAENGSSNIRAGNIGLAIADAGMTAKFNAFLKFLEHRDKSRLGEPDAQKRFVWALAISGQIEQALANLYLVADSTERFKALARVAEVAAKRRDHAALETISRMIIESQETPRPADEVQLVKVLFTAGRHEQALILAEDIIRRDIVSSASSAKATDDRGTSPRWKTVRRPLEPDTTSIEDETKASAVADLVSEGLIDEALDRASQIRIPVHRSRALVMVALKHKDAGKGLEAWLNAVEAARFAGRRAVEEILGPGKSVLSRCGRADEWDGLRAQLSKLEAKWELETFAEHYEGLRGSLEPSGHRTGRLTSLMLVPRRLARERAWTREELHAAFTSGQSGKRLFVLGLMQGNPAFIDADIVAEGIRGSHSAFEQYHALLLATQELHRFTSDQHNTIWSAIEEERGMAQTGSGRGVLRPGTDRWGLTEHIREALGR